MTRYVYFIRPVGMDGPIKIGCSTSPATRLESLAGWVPFPLEVVAIIPGDYMLERRLHDLFAQFHSHREWFWGSARLNNLLAGLVAGASIGTLIDLAAPIGPFRASRKVGRKPRLATPTSQPAEAAE